MKFIQVLYLAAALSVAPAGMMWAQNTSGHFMHTVTKGQSLYSISSMYNIPIAEIVKMNPGSDERIKVGQALKIPQTSAGNQVIFHTIQPGETLYKLSVKHGVSVERIFSAKRTGFFRIRSFASALWKIWKSIPRHCEINESGRPSRFTSRRNTSTSYGLISNIFCGPKWLCSRRSVYRYPSYVVGLIFSRWCSSQKSLHSVNVCVLIALMPSRVFFLYSSKLAWTSFFVLP